MAKKFGRNRNSSDEATTTTITLNDSTSTLIKAAGAFFTRFEVSNQSNRDVYIKLQAASVDNIKEGEFLPRGSVWTMPEDQLYIGEISAIADAGTPDITVNTY